MHLAEKKKPWPCCRYSTSVGLTFIMLLAIANGEQVVLHIKFDPDRVLADISRNWVSGGAPLVMEVLQRFDRGQSAKAFIALKPGHAALGIDELKSFLADKLAKYEMPTEMEIRASLSKTPVGKLSKKELLAEEIAKRLAVDVLPVSPPEVA